MLQHWIMEMVVRERLETMRAEAESARFLPETPIQQPHLPGRVIIAIGALLIVTGTFLQKRYTPISYKPSETDCSPC